MLSFHQRLARAVEHPKAVHIHKDTYCAPHLDAHGEPVPGWRFHIHAVPDMPGRYRFEDHCPTPSTGCGKEN